MTVNPYDAPIEKPVEAPDNPVVGDNPVMSSKEDVRMSVARALGMEKFSEIDKNKDKITRLIEWAELKGAKDKMDIVNSINQLANRLGSPSMGNNWATHLSNYAYLEAERLKIDKQLREMEK